MTQREKERLSGFCGQSLPDSRLQLSPKVCSEISSSGALQVNALISAGKKGPS